MTSTCGKSSPPPLPGVYTFHGEPGDALRLAVAGRPELVDARTHNFATTPELIAL